MTDKIKVQNCIRNEITVLKGNKHIRKRPKMYVGSLDKIGFDSLIEYVSEWVKHHSDPEVTIDNGNIKAENFHYKINRYNPLQGMTACEALFTELGAGSQDDSALVVLCALSEKLTVKFQNIEYVFSKGDILSITECETNGNELTISYDRDDSIWEF